LPARLLLAIALLGCACGRGLAVHAEEGGSAEPDSGIACDVIQQDCVNPSEGCYPMPTGARACASAGRRGEGAPCAQSTECVGGFACLGVGLGAPRVCHRMCAPNGTTNRCGEGQSCLLLSNPYFGVCTPAGDYSACVYSGGLDHLTVRRHEPARNLCTTIALTSPGNNSHPALMLASNWSATAGIERRDGGCPTAFTFAGAFAQTLSGNIDLLVPDGGDAPTQIDVFVNVFAPTDSGVPGELTLAADGLALGSCF
jgi:hypothetical protein